MTDCAAAALKLSARLPIHERPLMTTHLFVLALGVGAAAIAIWVDARFPGIAPSEYGYAFLHVLSAIAVGTFLVRPALAGVIELDPVALRAVGVLAVCLTALVYAFVAGVWVIKLTHALVARHLP